MKTEIRIAAALAALCLIMSGCGIIKINERSAETSAGGSDAVSSVPDHTAADDTAPALTGDSAAAPKGTESGKKPAAVSQPDRLAKAKSYLESLPKRDMQGVAVSITGSDITPFAVGDSEEHSLIDAARLERDSMVCEYYNTKILVSEATAQSVLDDVAAAVKADDFYADLLAIPVTWLGYFRAAGLLLNLESLPFTDYSQPYFDQKAMLQSAGGYGVYAAVGEYIYDPGYMYCMYVNFRLVEELGLDDPVELVNKGYWSWEKLREYAKAAAASEGVDGHAGPEGMSVDAYIDLLFASSGEHMVSTGKEVIPTLKEPSLRLKRMVSALKSYIYDDGSYAGVKNSGIQNFYGGGVLFLTETVSRAEWLADMADDWCILPMPRLDGRGDWYTPVSPSAPVLCVPKNCANLDNAGLFLQAANAASYGYINDVFYEHLTRNAIRNSDTLNMLDYVTCVNSGCFRYYDFSVMYGGQYDWLQAAAVDSVRKAVKGSSDLDSVYAASVKNVNNRLAAAFNMPW